MMLASFPFDGSANPLTGTSDRAKTSGSISRTLNSQLDEVASK